MKTKILLYLFILAFLFLLAGCLPKQKQGKEGGEEQMTDLTGKKVLMVVAPTNFRDEEMLEPKKVLESAGVQITIASKGVAEANGMLGGKTKVDVDINQIKVEDYHAVVFIGGSGSVIYFNDSGVLELTKKAVEQQKIIAAICIAPSILANAGILQNKKATAFSSEQNNLEVKGAIFINQPVVQDGKIITASGPQAAQAFGEKIAEMLK